MAIQALVPEPKVVALLDSRHLSYLGEFETRLLAALEFGYSVEAMVTGFHKSEATMRRHIADLKHRVFDYIDLTESTTLLNHWTRRHFPCCTQHAHEMIQNCQILSGAKSVSAASDA
jgi:hypothetical protein